MPTDATGTPTSLGIRKYNTSADAPSGLGFNGAMDDIDALLLARVTKPGSIASGEVPVWNGSTWVRSSATNIGPTSLGSGTPDATKFLRGDGTWAVAGSVMTLLSDTVAGGTVATLDTGAMTMTGVKHLLIEFNGRSDKAAATLDALALRFNNDSGNNYAWVNTDGASAASAALARIAYVAGATAPTNASTPLTVFIPDVSGTVFNKTFRATTTLNDAATPTFINKEFAATWKPATPAAITRVAIFPETSNLITGSRLTVYGLS